jgi:ABC-type dipeptide/oligopeptide/nickel transport system permease subunit
MQPPTPTWGGMLQSARGYGSYRAPWLIYFPGVCITVAVFCVNFLADRLQERFDPRRR